MYKPSSINNLEQLLQLSTHGELVAFCLDYAHENSNFEIDLMHFLRKKYIGNKDTTDEYVGQMRSAFKQTRNIGNRWHYFEDLDWPNIFSEALRLIEEGKKLLDVGNADTAATIAVEFFVQLSHTFDENSMFNQYDEELPGDYECEQAEELLLNAIDHPNISAPVLHKILSQLKDISKTNLSHDLSNYDIFDFDDMLMQVSTRTMSPDDSLRLLDEQIRQHATDYDLHVYVERKIDLLRKNGRDAEADDVERQHIALPQIRQIVVDRLIGNSDYDKAIACVDGGIAEAEKNHHILEADKWRKCILGIYEQTGNEAKQIEVCRLLFKSSGGCLDYYHKLKALVAEAEWKPFLTELLNEANLSRRYTGWGCNLADIYVEEGDEENLYNFIMRNSSHSTDALDRYATHAGEEHAEEFLKLYTNLLKSVASGPANVKMYPRIAESMTCMTKLKGGKEAAHKLAVHFREHYRRRPNFMIEISKF